MLSTVLGKKQAPEFALYRLGPQQEKMETLAQVSF